MGRRNRYLTPWLITLFLTQINIVVTYQGKWLKQLVCLIELYVSFNIKVISQ